MLKGPWFVLSQVMIFWDTLIEKQRVVTYITKTLLISRTLYMLSVLATLVVNDLPHWPKTPPMPTYLLPVGALTIPPPDESDPSSDQRGDHSVQGSWQRRKRSPGCRSREEGQHGGEERRAVPLTSGDNKCLNRRSDWGIALSYLVPVSKETKRAFC